MTTTSAAEKPPGSSRTHKPVPEDRTPGSRSSTNGTLSARPRAVSAGMGVMLALVAAAVAAILLAPVVLSSGDLLAWAAAPTGLGLPGQWPVLVILSLDAAAIACVLMSVLCTWRGERPGIFGTLVWVFAITSSFANWRHGLAPSSAPDRVWFIPLMSLTGPGVLEVVLHRVRIWTSNGQAAAAAGPGDHDQPQFRRAGVSWQRWIPGLGAFGDTFGAHRTRLLIPGVDSFDDAVTEFHRLCPDGSVRVAAALRRRHQAGAAAGFLAVLHPATAASGRSRDDLPVDLMKRIPVQPEPYQRWREAWADLQAATPASPADPVNGPAGGGSPLPGSILQAIADRHQMSTRQLQFIRRAGYAGLLASPIPPAVLMAKHAAAAAAGKPVTDGLPRGPDCGSQRVQPQLTSRPGQHHSRSSRPVVAPAHLLVRRPSTFTFKQASRQQFRSGIYTPVAASTRTAPGCCRPVIASAAAAARPCPCPANRRASPALSHFGDLHVPPQHQPPAATPDLAGPAPPTGREVVMIERILLGAVAAITGIFMAITCLLAIFFGGSSGSCLLSAGAYPLPVGTAGTGGPVTVDGFDAGQISNATAIVHTGASLGVPISGWIIAVAVAIQESGLHNLDHGDTAGPDSRGLFQQRAAWGPLADRMDPTKASQMFYLGGAGGQDGLLDITDWQAMPLTQAAEAVQHPQHTGIYAAREDDATRLVAAVSGLDAPPPSAHPSPGTPDSFPSVAPGANPFGRPSYSTWPLTSSAPGASSQTGVSALTVSASDCAGAPDPQAAQAVAYARTQIGVPYQWGGNGVTAGDAGFDCSGLTKAAYAQAGIDLPRTAQDQYDAGPLLPPDAPLQPGDLVFFGTGPSNVTHVGIYTGNNQMIDAPHHGATVRTETLWNDQAGASRPAARAGTTRSP